jgi:hypothetical protein
MLYKYAVQEENDFGLGTQACVQPAHPMLPGACYLQGL